MSASPNEHAAQAVLMNNHSQHAAQAAEANAFVRSLTEKLRQEAGTFKPPMAKEFGVEGRHQPGFDGHAALQPIQLLASTLQKMLGMLAGAFQRPLGLVGLLAIEPAAGIADAVQFQAKGSAGG